MKAPERERWPLKTLRLEKRPENGDELCWLNFILGSELCTECSSGMSSCSCESCSYGASFLPRAHTEHAGIYSTSLTLSSTGTIHSLLTLAASSDFPYTSWALSFHPAGTRSGNALRISPSAEL